MIQRFRVFFPRLCECELRHFQTGRRIIIKTLAYACIVAGVEGPVFAQSIGPAAPFSIAPHGLASFATSNPGNIATGYGQIQVPSITNGKGLPYGLTIYGERQDGVLVSEAAVPAQAPVNSGRLYIEVAGSVDTGIAIANPNMQPVSVGFYFTDANGNDFGQSSVIIPATRQIACFVSQAPFNAPSNFRGTLTFQSASQVSVMALQIRSNERGEFLMSTVPSTNDLIRSNDIVNPLAVPQTIPEFQDGGGWTTTIILTNPGDATITGNIQMYAQGPPSYTHGTPISVTLNGTTNSTFSYSIPPHSFVSFESAGTSATSTLGVVDILPDNGALTASFALLRHQTNGVTINELTVPVSFTSDTWDVYVESVGDFAGAGPGSVQSGIAVASGYLSDSNPLPSFNLQLYSSDGQLLGEKEGFFVSSPGAATFMLNAIPGMPQVTPPFRGILRVVVDPLDRFSPHGARVTGVRARYNERGELLMTTTPTLLEVCPGCTGFFASSTELLFPQFAVGGGWQTEFVLFSDGGSTGTMYLFDPNDAPISLPAQ
jgi:hypothetical protein